MTDELAPLTDDTQEPESREPAPPITDRFLFVDVAALRAKQLRRGALPRIELQGEAAVLPAKPERIAMEEVRRGLVDYETPAMKARNPEAAA